MNIGNPVDATTKDQQPEPEDQLCRPPDQLHEPQDQLRGQPSDQLHAPLPAGSGWLSGAPCFTLLHVRETIHGRGCFASQDIPTGAPVLVERPMALSRIGGGGGGSGSCLREGGEGSGAAGTGRSCGLNLGSKSDGSPTPSPTSQPAPSSAEESIPAAPGACDGWEAAADLAIAVVRRGVVEATALLEPRTELRRHESGDVHTRRVAARVLAAAAGAAGVLVGASNAAAGAAGAAVGAPAGAGGAEREPNAGMTVHAAARLVQVAAYNSMELSLPRKGAARYQALCARGSMLNHSCRPNALQMGFRRKRLVPAPAPAKAQEGMGAGVGAQAGGEAGAKARATADEASRTAMGPPQPEEASRPLHPPLQAGVGNGQWR
jgi:hypothetical protein